MSNTYNIEKTVIASVLNSEIDADLQIDYFTTEFHRKLVSGINRLKTLGEYIDFEILRNKFLEVKKWNFQEDEMLLDMMTNTTPFTTNNIFNRYLTVLKNSSRISKVSLI